MDQEKAYSLLNRQLKDIIATAERIVNGSDSAEEIESFARYSLPQSLGSRRVTTIP